MNKEDYLKLSKDRLAELLAKQDRELSDLRNLFLKPMAPPLVLQQARPLCYEEGGICTNPQMDCVNCPRLQYTGGTISINTGTSFQQ